MNIRILCVGFMVTSLMAPLAAHADKEYHKHKKHRHHDHGHVHVYSHSTIVYADVIEVRPITEIVHVQTPQRECWSESTVSVNTSHSSGAGMVLGGILGGAIGHNIAKGHDREVAILAGTLLGAAIGHDVERTSHAAPVTRTRCQTYTSYTEERRVVGYRVKYRYRNHTHVTRTDHHPGSRIQITLELDD